MPWLKLKSNRPPRGGFFASAREKFVLRRERSVAARLRIIYVSFSYENCILRTTCFRKAFIIYARLQIYRAGRDSSVEGK